MPRTVAKMRNAPHLCRGCCILPVLRRMRGIGYRHKVCGVADSGAPHSGKNRFVPSSGASVPNTPAPGWAGMRFLRDTGGYDLPVTVRCGRSFCFANRLSKAVLCLPGPRARVLYSGHRPWPPVHDLLLAPPTICPAVCRSARRSGPVR